MYWAMVGLSSPTPAMVKVGPETRRALIHSRWDGVRLLISSMTRTGNRELARNSLMAVILVSSSSRCFCRVAIWRWIAW